MPNCRQHRTAFFQHQSPLSSTDSSRTKSAPSGTNHPGFPLKNFPSLSNKPNSAYFSVSTLHSVPSVVKTMLPFKSVR